MENSKQKYLHELEEEKYLKPGKMMYLDIISEKNQVMEVTIIGF